MKKLFGFLLIGLITSTAIISCKDDFNEEDFLKLQSDLRLKQDSINRSRNKTFTDSLNKQAVESYVDALNQAGDLMSVTLTIRDNNVPVSGASVSISNGTTTVTAGRTEAVITATTDASGNAVFNKVFIGRNNVIISKTGYATATATLNFGRPGDVQQVTVPVLLPNGTSTTRTYYLPPQKRFETGILPLFSKTGTATATIKGKVTIETDVTNNTSEIPQNVTVLADFSGLVKTTNTITLAVGVNGGNIGFNVDGYQLDDANFGSGVVNNTTGEYSLTVPASATAYTATLLFPTLEVNQRVAVASLDGKMLATGPEYRNVPTIFGPNAGTYDNIPFVRGAKVTFNAPPASGRGFGSTFTAVARSLETGTISNDGTNNVLTNTRYNISNRGRGFSSAPTVAITGGGGTGATAVTSLRGFITSANVSSGGTGYAASTTFQIQFTYTDKDGNTFALSGVNPISITSNASGVLPTGDVTLPNSFGYIGNSPFTTVDEVAGFGVRVVNFGTNTVATATTQAGISVTRDTELNSVTINKGGSGFTSAPTLAFSGGGSPTTNASVSCVAFKTQFSMALTNAGTVPYKVTPSDIRLVYGANAFEAAVDETTIDLLNNIGNVSSTQSLISSLTTDGTNLVPLNSGLSYRTNRFWTSAPTISVVDRTIQQARASVTIDATTGELTFLNPTTDVTSNFDNTTNNLQTLTVAGSGYDAITATIAPSATGAPGSGQSFTLTTALNATSREVTWSGATTRLSGGSGFVQNLNFITSPVPATTSPGASVRTGQTYIVDYNYGTGRKKENVTANAGQGNNGNWYIQ